jgi:hypothetical protein
VHVGEPISPDDPKAIEDMAGYVTRASLSLQRLAYIEGQQAVICKALGLSLPEDTKPPPAVRDAARVPLDDDGWGIAASPGPNAQRPRAARAFDTCRRAAARSLQNTAEGDPATRDPGQHALRRPEEGLTPFAALTLPLRAASGVTLTPLPAPGAEAKPYG